MVDVIQKMLPQAKACIEAKPNKEMPLADFEKVYGEQMTQALVKGRWAEVADVRMVDRQMRVPPRTIRIIRLL